jgi:DNA-binding response OmpR family regulator
LELVKFRTLVARTGEEALSALLVSEGRPAVVLLDLHLPDLDGLEICRLLRAETQTERIPIIMLTAYASEADRARGLEAGVDTYITKPYPMRDVISTIRAALSQAQSISPAVL